MGDAADSDGRRVDELTAVRTFLEFTTLCVALGAGMWVIGMPIRVWLLDDPDAGTRSPVPSVLIGMGVVQLVAWYWLDRGGDGLGPPVVALLLAGAVGSLVTLPRWWRATRPDRSTDRAHTVALVATVVGAFVVFAFGWSSLFHLDLQTSASLGNNDVASYAFRGEHLEDQGFDTPSNIPQLDFETLTRTDSYGSTVVLGAAGEATGLGAWRMTMPFLAVLSILLAAALARLLLELFPARPAVAAIAAAAASGTLLFRYITGEYFGGQVMGMGAAVVLAAVALRAVRASGRGPLVRLALGAAAAVVVMMSHYGQMLVPSIVVLVAAAAVAVERRTDVVRSVGRAGAVVAGGTLLGFLVAPQWLDITVDRSRALVDTSAGWPLPGFLPVELLGFGDSVSPKGHGRVITSVAVMVVFLVAAAVVARRHRRAAVYAVLTVALVLVSHLAVYLREGGPTYRQWKWVTFFQPAFAALVFAVVAVAVEELLRRWDARAALTASVAVLVVVGAVVLNRSDAAFGRLLGGDHPAVYVDAGLSHLHDNPALAGIGAVNIDVAPYWDTMWAAYFLDDRTVYLESENYYGVTAPAADWTVVPRPPNLSGSPYVPLTERFLLQRDWSGPLSTQLAGLDGVVDAEVVSRPDGPGGTMVLRVTVTNSGTTGWLVAGRDQGLVRIGIQLADSTGRVVNRDYLRADLVPSWDRPLPPGAVVTVDVGVPVPDPTRDRFQVQMVSELTGWFGQPAAVAGPTGDLVTSAGAGAR
jgi:hypothetical protein